MMIRFSRPCLLVLCCILPVLSAYGQSTPEDYFVFLTSGKSSEGIAKEIIQQKQVAHIDNFKRLAKLGMLFAAGPCADPAKHTRGIVVIKADSLDDAISKFGPDPYVTEGFLNAELNPYKVLAGKLQLVLEDVPLEESTIVILSQGSGWEDTNAEQSIDAIKQFVSAQHAAGKLGFAALFHGKTNDQAKRVAMMFFRGKVVPDVSATLESSAFVANKSIRFEAFPQYMAQGTIAK
jgi:uncharacterized protein YciI